MSDQTEVKGIEDTERAANKAIYTGKRMYAALVELRREIFSAKQQKVTDTELGSFATMDVDTLIEEARVIGNVPVWNAESTPVGKKLTYKLYDGAKPVAQ